MIAIRAEAENEPARVKTAPYPLLHQRIDEVRAARKLDLQWRK
jgi:glycine dehydrogenase subunit 2